MLYIYLIFEMKVNLKIISAVTISTAMLSLTGCDKIPQTEIDQASLALNEAKVAGADVYFLNDFLGLQDTMAIVLQKIEVENTEPITNFSAYKENLLRINERAITLKYQTEERKEILKTEFMSAITAVDSLILSNQQLLTTAPSEDKDRNALLDSLNVEHEAVKATLHESNDLMSKGELLPSLEKVKIARERATGLHTRILKVAESKKANS